MQFVKREIRYEDDRDPEFVESIRRMPGCELMDRCIQCATCSGICPLSDHMDLTPRRVIELTRHGFKKDVLGCKTIWVCSSCYQCQIECPKLIGITDVMYALKTKAIEEGATPKRLPIPVLAREFFRMVKDTGRVTESRLVQRLLFKTSPFRFWGMRRLGVNLMKTGRFSLAKESMRHPDRLRKVLEGLEPLVPRRKS